MLIAKHKINKSIMQLCIAILVYEHLSDICWAYKSDCNKDDWNLKLQLQQRPAMEEISTFHHSYDPEGYANHC